MRFELVLAVLGLFIPIAIFAGAVPSPAEVKPRPNIVMILSDDQDTQSYKFMPKTWALLGKRGTVFENYFVTSSLCSLSRASILRGQCLHNTPKPIVLDIDLASTFAHMANGRPAKFVNGRSFLPLFDGPERSWRRMFRIGQLELKSLHAVKLVNLSSSKPCVSIAGPISNTWIAKAANCAISEGTLISLTTSRKQPIPLLSRQCPCLAELA
jgi:hypothetical protein